MFSREVAQARTREFARAEEIEITGELGFGIDGWVFRSNRASALKVFESRKKYETERDIYLRLHERQVKDILGHSVPELLHYHDQLQVIEMSIVQPPYLLDFAQATLDTPPDFSDDALEMWRAEKAEQFGQQWPQVQAIMAMLEARFGIHLIDVNPGNVTFGDQSY